MTQRIIRRTLIVFALALASVNIAVAQPSTSSNADKAPIGNASASRTWESAVQVWSMNGKLTVVTVDQPNRRQSCHVQTYTPDELVCSRGKGHRRTYLRQQVAAILLPGYGSLQRWLPVVLHGASAAAVWGTVVLAASCPVCAAATSFYAAGCLIGAAFARGDDQSDRLLYLAPGQQLSRKFAHIRS